MNNNSRGFAVVRHAIILGALVILVGGALYVIGSANNKTTVQSSQEISNQLPEFFSKDDAHVYYSGKILEGADPNTFTAVLPYQDYPRSPMVKDKNHVYIASQILPNADPATFVPIWFKGVASDYYKDKNNVWFVGLSRPTLADMQIGGADPTTFILDDIECAPDACGRNHPEIATSTAHDKNHSYSFGKVVQ